MMAFARSFVRAREGVVPEERPGAQARVLEIEGLTVNHAGAPILQNVSLSIAPGECVAVIGESGAGKSVLARTVLGLTQATPRWQVNAETLRIAGQELRRAKERQWRKLRGSTVSLILQDALQSLDPLRTIENEVGETLSIRGIRSSARRGAVIEALQLAGFPDAEPRLKQRSGALSGGMRQRALIASALVGHPKLVVADEPTTALDPTTAARIGDLFTDMRERGTALLLISHDLESVARIADRIIVLDEGRIVEEGTTDEITRRPQHPVTRALIEAIPRGPKPASAAAPDPDSAFSDPSGDPELVRLEGVSRQFMSPTGERVGLNPIDLVIRRGESLGVVGESGAGKTTLARILVGAERAGSGTIHHATPAPRIRLIPQDPFATFDPRWRVGRIIATSNRLSHVTAEDLLVSVGLDPDLVDRHPLTLSGGQRQRVAIARALGADPDILVCDEPVSALDVSTQTEILDLLRDLQARRGLAIVFVSHDLAAVRTMCDRMLIMRDGTVVEEGATETIFGHPMHEFTRALIASARGLPR